MVAQPLYISKEQLLDAMKAGCRIHGPLFNGVNVVGSLAPWLKPFLPPFQRADTSVVLTETTSDTVSLEKFLSDAGEAAALLSENSSQSNDLPKLKSSVLAEALADAATYLKSLPGFEANSLSRLNMRRGLQLYMVEIVPDDADSGVSMPLDLSNGDFDFSLRLICCVVRAPLALSNLNLVTLDLSGSALAGVDGSFLRARGSVRLRNSSSSGPVDFTGAEVHGYLDASNSLIHPFGPLPAGQAVSGDRGMLNLSQAHISNEVRLGGAKILGGLSMRGLKTERSVFLQDAFLLSPLAVLEQVLARKRNSSTAATASNNKFLALNLKDFYDGLTYLSSNTPFIKNNGKQTCLDILMKETLRVRTSALRADGIKVAGSIFAQDITGLGRIRLKYAEVAGSLTLQGADLKSAEAQLLLFEEAASPNTLVNPARSEVEIQICRYRKTTYDDITGTATDILAPGADDYALDLRESRFGGSVRIGIPNVDQAPQSQNRTTEIDGVLALERATLHSDLILDGTKFTWTSRITTKNWKFNPEDPDSDEVEFSVASNRSQDQRNVEVEGGDRYNIEATGIDVGGDFSLLKSSGLNGINLSDSNIGGDLALFGKMQRKKASIFSTQAEANTPIAPIAGGTVNSASTQGRIVVPDTRAQSIAADASSNHSGHVKESSFEPAIEVTQFASGLKGRLQLAGSKIGGDCKLLFHRSLGPHIKAERIEVGGALAIGPKGDAGGFGVNSYQELIEKGREETANIRHVASFGAEQWNKFRFSKPPFEFKDDEKSYQIDLGNARSVFLHHPWLAWPTTGHLIIAGFHYERALEFGPLAPNPFPDGADKAFRSDLTIGFFITLGLSALSAFLFSCWMRILYLEPAIMGRSEILVLLVFLACSAFYRLVRSSVSPNKFQARPMALEWLATQVSDRNVYRSNLAFAGWVYGYGKPLPKSENDGPGSPPDQVDRAERAFWHTGHIYHSLEPYSVAVKALRESGRWVSANLVEEERLRVRDDQLSWRNHLIQKSLFRLIQLLNNYGFNLSRPLFWVCVLVCCSTVLTYQAAVNGAITPKVMQVDTGSRPPPPLKPTEVVTCTNACYPIPVGLNTLVFSVDQVVPLVDLGQNSNWEVDKTIAPRWAPPWLTFEILFFFIRIIGFAMVGLLILAFSTRISLVHQRYSD